MRSTLVAFRKTLLAALIAAGSAPASAQPLAITHDGLDCWPSDLYPILSGAFSPPDDVRSVRIYFRSEVYPDFYFVDATVQADGRLEAVLPMAAPGTPRVIYYIEAVTRAFESTRTREWDPEVSESDECRRRDPLLALFQGKIPNIVISSVRAGAPAFPPGFMTAGIVAAGSGGLGATAIVGIVAGGVAGGVVIANGGEGPPSATTTALAAPSSTSIPSGSISTAPSSTTSAPGTPPPSTTSAPTTTSTPGASTTTTAIPTTTTTTAGSPTTTTVLPPTTTSAPPTTTSTSPTTTSVPTTTSTPPTTTSTPPTTTSIPPTTTTSAPPGADMAVTISAPASARIGTLIRYQVVVRNNGPAAASGARATISLPLGVTFQSASLGSCSGFFGTVQCDLGAMAAGGTATIQIAVLTFQLGTVTASASVGANQPDPAPGNNNASATTNVTLLLRESPDSFALLSVQLDVPPGDGRDSGEVVVGSRLAGVDDTAPVELSVSSEPGEYVVEAVLTGASGRRGKWRFDFRVAPEIEVAEILVDAGSVATTEPRAVSFHTRGESGERLRFRYRLIHR